MMRSQWLADTSDGVITESVPQVLARQVAAHGARPAVYWEQDSELAHLTYADLAAAATAVARALAGQAAPGERVAVWSRNSLAWVLLEYGCALAGLILTPLNPAWTDPEVEHAIQLTGPALFFAGTGPQGESLLPRASAHADRTTVLDLAGLPSWSAAVPAGELAEVPAATPLLIQFTSGTTGRAKGALISHQGALNTGRLRNLYDVMSHPDVYLNPVPYHHIGGSCCIILGALVDAGAFVLAERWDPGLVVRLLRRGPVNRIGGVPTMMFDLLGRLGDGASAVTVKSVSLGGAKVPQLLVERVQDAFGAPVVVTYAQSESSIITSSRVGDDPAVIARTVGRPVAGVELRICDPASGAVVPLGAPGEMDDAGNVTFRGRVRDVIIRGGENIYPAEVEEALLAHPGVAAAVVVGLDDERLGERVAGVVVRVPGSEATGEELAGYLHGRLARFKIPQTWRFVDQLPMTASGKVRRFVVRDQARADQARADQARADQARADQAPGPAPAAG
jgi:fatty-acyl-CoA synthase